MRTELQHSNSTPALHTGSVTIPPIYSLSRLSWALEELARRFGAGAGEKLLTHLYNAGLLLCCGLEIGKWHELGLLSKMVELLCTTYLLLHFHPIIQSQTTTVSRANQCSCFYHHHHHHIISTKLKLIFAANKKKEKESYKGSNKAFCKGHDKTMKIALKVNNLTQTHSKMHPCWSGLRGQNHCHTVLPPVLQKLWRGGLHGCLSLVPVSVSGAGKDRSEGGLDLSEYCSPT